VGTYRFDLDLDARAARADHVLDLGEVRDSARVRINGQDVGTAWSMPFTLPVHHDVLRPGRNVVEVEVTNATANRVRALARSGRLVVPHFTSWRSGQPPAEWDPVPSGLLGPVRLSRVRSERA
jgi:hypothetical protein